MRKTLPSDFTYLKYVLQFNKYTRIKSNVINIQNFLSIFIISCTMFSASTTLLNVFRKYKTKALKKKALVN